MSGGLLIDRDSLRIRERRSGGARRSTIIAKQSNSGKPVSKMNLDVVELSENCHRFPMDERGSQGPAKRIDLTERLARAHFAARPYAWKNSG